MIMMLLKELLEYIKNKDNGNAPELISKVKKTK